MAPPSKIFPTLLFLTTACSIYGATVVHQSCDVDIDCIGKTSYSIKHQQSMEVILYFDGNADPDVDYVRAMCKARSSLKKVKFTFVPGVRITEDDSGKLQCPTGDCVFSIIDACALSLAPDFTEFVCVEYDKSSKFMSDVYKKLNLDEKKFDKCIALKDQNIKPKQILLKNSEKAKAAHPYSVCYPYMSFNGKSDACARQLFVDNPVKVICAMLASGVDEKCSK